MCRVSVIVPTYNRLFRLKHVLAGLEQQTVSLEGFEVIVVSDGSTDGTNEYLKSLQTPLQFRFVSKTNSGAASARNVGTSQAIGDLVLFVDDDVVPTPVLIAEHLRIHDAHSQNMVVLGPMLTPQGFRMSPWVRWEQAMLMKQYDAMRNGEWGATARQFYTGNSSLLREQLLAAGGFDERFGRAEDVELGYRLAERGLKFEYNPDAIGYHYAERSFKSWMITPYVYGRSDVVFSRDMGHAWLLTQLLREFRGRHPIVQMLVRTCLCRQRCSSFASSALRLVARIGGSLGWERASQGAYSGIFNLRYYQGIADELGGRRDFFSRLSSF